ncbi:hypothetical protein QL285_088326 [Trifolium repens]|nr:hypothetical protein QL285_088326 [Trifolium repens]
MSTVMINDSTGEDNIQHRDGDKGRLISKGIAKGAKRIEMLLLDENDDFDIRLTPYKFSFTFLSDTDSLTYLHLQKCLIAAPMKFSGLKNLSTLVLDALVVKQDLLQGLFSNCIHLVDFTLDKCPFFSDIKIISSTLFHLKIIDCGYKHLPPYKIDIDALNLSSFEYSGHRTMLSSVKAPSLLKVFCNATVRRKSRQPFSPVPRLHLVENLVMITSHSQVAELKKNYGQF